jgi:hypothetical protein
MVHAIGTRIRLAIKIKINTNRNEKNSKAIAMHKERSYFKLNSYARICIYVLWHVYPLLGNDPEISNYTTAVIRQRPVNSKRGKMLSV